MPRRLSIRKILQTLVTLVAVTGCALAMISADRQQRRRTVREVQLTVNSPAGVRFISEDAVTNMLFRSRHINPNKLSVAQLDERSMEAILQTNPWIGEAQVYTDAERVMHISVTQRVPVVRLFEDDGASYYLDAHLKSMPLSTQYTHYTPVVTGVPVLRNDSLGTVIRGTIVGLIQAIARQPFWNAQVSQVAMRLDGGFELVPILGKQRIIIGDTGRLEEKLAALFAFYKQVHDKVGWDKYRTLDLRYKDQVVASPALPWKIPRDNALSTMSWLKAIMDAAPAKQGLLGGGDATAFADSVGTVALQPVAAPASPQQSVTIPTAAHPQTASVRAQTPTRQPSAGHSHTAQPQPGKNTSRHNQNTPPHAATNR